MLVYGGLQSLDQRLWSPMPTRPTPTGGLDPSAVTLV
jgi:hypothetical protein